MQETSYYRMRPHTYHITVSFPVIVSIKGSLTIEATAAVLSGQTVVLLLFLASLLWGMLPLFPRSHLTALHHCLCRHHPVPFPLSWLPPLHRTFEGQFRLCIPCCHCAHGQMSDRFPFFLAERLLLKHTQPAVTSGLHPSLSKPVREFF